MHCRKAPTLGNKWSEHALGQRPRDIRIENISDCKRVLRGILSLAACRPGLFWLSFASIFGSQRLVGSMGKKRVRRKCIHCNAQQRIRCTCELYTPGSLKEHDIKEACRTKKKKPEEAQQTQRQETQRERATAKTKDEPSVEQQRAAFKTASSSENKDERRPGKLNEDRGRKSSSKRRLQMQSLTFPNA